MDKRYLVIGFLFIGASAALYHILKSSTSDSGIVETKKVPGMLKGLYPEIEINKSKGGAPIDLDKSADMIIVGKVPSKSMLLVGQDITRQKFNPNEGNVFGY